MTVLRYSQLPKTATAGAKTGSDEGLKLFFTQNQKKFSYRLIQSSQSVEKLVVKRIIGIPENSPSFRSS